MSHTGSDVFSLNHSHTVPDIHNVYIKNIKLFHILHSWNIICSQMHLPVGQNVLS